MFDLIMLWWVLPSCIMFLIMVNRIKKTYDLTPTDWGFITLFSVLWPIGGILTVFAWVYDAYLQWGDRCKVGLIKLSCVLIKKRTFLLSRRVNDEDWESVDD